jgi:hypothetical protein
MFAIAYIRARTNRGDCETTFGPVEIPLSYRKHGTYRGGHPAANLKK